MLGKPEWFERRKYGGWGIHPVKWQGWVYIAVFMLVLIVVNLLDMNMVLRLVINLGWVLFLLLDVAHIMINLKRDEREYKIEAVCDRNAAWFMMIVLVIGVLVDAVRSAIAQTIMINWFLVAALWGGVIVKTISEIYFQKRGM